jgi:hypothetical protein
MLNLPLDPYHFTLVLIALISGVISPIVIQLTKYYISLLRLPPKKEKLSKVLKYEDLITHKLEKIKDRYKADRVWIVEFHNGVHTFSGKSVQKFSVTYEVVSPGVAREGQTTQNIPTSLFSKFFKTISDEIVFRVDDVTNVNSNNSSLQSFFESRGTKSFLALGIRNIENSLIGVLCLETITSLTNISEEQVLLLKSDANVLAGYLETLE